MFSKERSRQLEKETLSQALQALQKIHGEEQVNKERVRMKKKRRESAMATKEDEKIDDRICCCGKRHPTVPGFQANLIKCMFYVHISKIFPYTTLFRVLDTEAKFVSADIDDSGFIDISELDNILKNTMGKVPKRILEDTFRKIDLDKSGTLDFTEVLQVLDSVIQRRGPGLPREIESKYHKTCQIQ